jgi:hypothetical protein
MKNFFLFLPKVIGLSSLLIIGIIILNNKKDKQYDKIN